MVVRAQMKIQQMAFMIVALFFFFALVGLGFIAYTLKANQGNYEDLQKEEALKFVQSLADMPELSCGSGFSCIDEDKIYALSEIRDYDIWPVSSIKVYKIYPLFSQKINCPAPNCNYYEIFNSKQTNVREYGTYVPICKKIRENYVFTKCEIGKLVVGVKLKETKT